MWACLVYWLFPNFFAIVLLPGPAAFFDEGPRSLGGGGGLGGREEAGGEVLALTLGLGVVSSAGSSSVKQYVSAIL